MSLFTEPNLKALEKGDLKTLVSFDEHGLLIAPGESPAEFAERVRTLVRNIAELRQEVSKTGKAEFLDTQLQKQDEIGPGVFESAREVTRKLYGFAIDWVPGFFTNYRMGLLFAGCAYYSYEDFFALFILRKSFQKQEKWLIYSRTELMSHELCHIAHIGFRALNYEEFLAYQTATSWFRRVVGGLFRTPADTWTILGAVLFLLVAQSVNVFTRPPEDWNRFPMPLIFGLVFATVLAIVVRYLFFLRRFRRARARLADAFGAESAMAVLFRCSEAEVNELAGLAPGKAAGWVAKRPANDPRWQVIRSRFPSREAARSQN